MGSEGRFSDARDAGIRSSGGSGFPVYNRFMSHKIIAPVSAAALRWARETAGYPAPEDAIAKFPASLRGPVSGRLSEWESGAARPTVPQARKLAKFYRRPLTDLYLREIPEDMKDPEPPDFRRGASRRPFSPNLRLLLRQADERRKWAREFLMESPESGHFVRPPDFRARPDAEALGAKIRAWLGADARELTEVKTREDARECWTKRAESRGVIVLQSHRHSAYQVPTDEFSGCAMTDDIAPVVVLNSGDSNAKRIFTLAHEIAHLWIAAPGVSRVSFRADAFSDDDDEAYCNRAAAAALLPLDDFRQAWQEAPGGDADKIDRIADVFKVSHSAVAVRAARAGFISRKRCDKLLDEYDKLARQAAAQKSGGRALPDKQALGRVGDYFARLTLDAYEQGVISALDVGDLFGVKLDHLGKIAERLRFPLHRWAR